VNGIETGLYSALLGDTAIYAELGGSEVYNRAAPQGTARPHIVFFHAGGGHENINPSDMQNHVYMVKTVADTAKKAGDIDELIIDCLHNGELTVTGYTNFWMAREEEVQITETGPDGRLIFHTGGYYRVRIDQ